MFGQWTANTDDPNTQYYISQQILQSYFVTLLRPGKVEFAPYHIYLKGST